MIKVAAKQQQEAGVQAYSPRTTSLTVQKYRDIRDNAEEKFFQALEKEILKIGQFTEQVVDGLRERLFNLQTQAKTAVTPDEKELLEMVRHMVLYFETIVDQTRSVSDVPSVFFGRPHTHAA